MRRLCAPQNDCRRIRTFLQHHQTLGERRHLSRADLAAFVKSFWRLGVWYRDRWTCRRFVAGTKLRRPRQFRCAIALAIIGHHFRRIAAGL